MLTYTILMVFAGMLAAVAPALVLISGPSEQKTSGRIWAFMTLALVVNIGVIALVSYAESRDEESYVQQSVVRTIGIMGRACPSWR
ncbi:MAG: hypothetical protein Q7J45_01080 [bacterium]|nr:hypothetical protein [bacterium]